MIEYDPHDWRSHLFDIRGSLVREIFSRVLTCLAWTGFVVALFHWQGFLLPKFQWQLADHFTISPALHGMLGFSIGLLLVFRTNSSYDRFWEGRKLWGGMVNQSRNLARLACVHLARDSSLRNELVRWNIAFVYACKDRLRGKPTLIHAADRLPPLEWKAAVAMPNLPLEIARRMSLSLKRGAELGLLSEIMLAHLDQQVNLLIDYQGGCERIHKTPLPFAYMVHLRRVLLLYLFTLPFALYRDFGLITIFATGCVAFIFLGIEEIGVEIEDPFEAEDNDLPLEAICATIERDLSALIGE